MVYLRLLLLTGLVLGCFSCSKEMSDEDPTKRTPSANCQITQVIPFDAVGKGRGSYTLETTNNLPSKVILYDSTTASIFLSIGFTHKEDSIKMSEDEYFVLDGEGRVKELVIREIPGRQGSPKFRYKYHYDSQGYLKLKEWFLLSDPAPIPLFICDYFWENGNLVKTEVKEALGARRLAMRSQISYATNQQAKNFLHCFPESSELSPFILMLNLGKKPHNLISQIVVEVYDANGGTDDKFITNYKDYKFTDNGEVAELMAEGDIVDGLAIVQGLTKFKYYCK